MMSTELLGVLLGAGIASLVPFITLRQTEKRWRIEKRMEILRVKRDRVESMYAEILGKMPEMLLSATYSSQITSKICVGASQEFRELFFSQIEKKESDNFKLKQLILNMTLAANMHVAAIEKEIDDLLL